MTVEEIQSVVAMYLQRSVAKFDVTGTGANLILVAMNNARKYAERRHNWSVCRKKGYLSVTTANEVAWDSPTWFGGGTEKMKEGKHWWLRGDATDTTNKVSTTDCPIKILGHGVKHVVETKQNYEAWGEDYAELRQVRESSSWHPMLNQPHGVVRGKWLELYPRPTSTQILVVDGYAWWAPWTTYGVETVSVTFPLADLNDADEDGAHFLVTRGQGIYAFEDDRLSDGLQHNSGSYFLTSTGSFAVDPGTILEGLEPFGFTVTVSGANVTISAPASLGALSVELRNNAVAQQWIVNSAAVSADTTDWWTENAEEFLILRTLVECNRLGHVFTGNKEGNLPSPEKAAEQALQVLIDQDNAGEMAGGQIELY